MSDKDKSDANSTPPRELQPFDADEMSRAIQFNPNPITGKPYGAMRFFQEHIKTSTGNSLATGANSSFTSPEKQH